MADTHGNSNRINWWKQVSAWAVGVATATVPLYVALLMDRDLQRTELGIANQHAAYTDFLNAADAVILPSYIFWDRMHVAEGQPSLTYLQKEEIVRDLASAFPDDSENSQVLLEAATRLRLVIQADDAELISNMTDSLDRGSSFFDSSGDGSKSADDRLNAYTDAMLAIVNEFRVDVLGEEALETGEAEKLMAKTEEDLRLQRAWGAAGESMGNAADLIESNEGRQ